MEIKSDRRTVASSTSSQAALQRVYVVEAANGAEKKRHLPAMERAAQTLDSTAAALCSVV